MSEQNFSSSRIAKNTIALYLRSFLSMLIGLYSSRVLLRVLGVEDFGVYQAVGGMVALFGFMNSTMAVSSQRFLNYEMGLSNKENVRKVFCTSINIQLCIAIVMTLACEIIGLYSLYYVLNIPVDRIYAAQWVLHFSIITLFVSIVSVPYNALIIAKEDMKSFAYIDICGSLLRLFAILLLEYFEFDYLILYAIFMVIVQLIIRYLYKKVCDKRYEEAQYTRIWDKELFKKMMSFSGWTTLSAITYMFRSQGISVLYNAFYGVVVSAAIGISNQVNSAITTLVNNFTTSFNPQLTKNYASGDFDKCQTIHYSGPKFSFFLVSIISAPILINTDYILGLWLKNVPEYTSLFIWLILIESMLRALISTCNTVVRATGNVKTYEIVCNAIQIFFLLIAYFSFVYSDNISLPFICLIISVFLMSLYMVFVSCKAINISAFSFIVNVYVRMCLPYSALILFVKLCFNRADTFFPFLMQSILIFLSILILDWIVGFNKKERLFIKNVLINKVFSKLHKSK